MPEVHSTAIVDDNAQLHDTVQIGPYCVVGANVKLGDGVRVGAHVVIDGHTDIGSGTEIFSFACVGSAPQHRAYRGEPTRLEIGRNCVIREYATLNPGTVDGRQITTIGDNCLLMIGAHVAHDCKVGDDVILTNNATLGGHCDVGDRVIIGGLAGAHQFVRLGELCFVGGVTPIMEDVIPFGSVLGNRAYLGGLNIVGLKRAGYSREDIHALRRAYRLLFAQEGTLRERVEDVADEFADDLNVGKIISFIRAKSERKLCTPRGARML